MKSLSPDQEFENPRLAALYDEMAGERPDLDAYVALVEEFEPTSVLDLGCGTGTLLSKLVNRNIDLVGVDPAKASLQVAIQKAEATKIEWVLGGSEAIPARHFDMVLMTGNVAQVFLNDNDWKTVLKDIHQALSPSGVLVFETRNPDAQCWKQWDQKSTFKSKDIDDIGRVDSWCEVTSSLLPYVSFKWTYVFHTDDSILTSESTIRYRNRMELEESLSEANFSLLDVRDAVDRPGKELVFIARKF